MKKAVFLISTILCLVFLLFDANNYTLSIYMVIWSSILSIYNIITLYNGRFTLSSSLISYTILTQFGLIIPYYFIGNSVLSEYSDWTLSFLTSPNLSKSIMLGAFAILTFETVRLYIKINNGNKEDYFVEQEVHDGVLSKFATLLLSVVLLYFVFHIATGGMMLFSAYEMFLASSAASSPVYPYILILFYVATVYNVASGELSTNRIGWGIWLVIVLIFALNGNKGEFLYALLTAFGVLGLRGKKLNVKYIIVGAFLLFVLIPSITALRELGVASNLNRVSYNPFAAFVEMGMQIRTTVYTLDDMLINQTLLLYGESYWRPILNILQLGDHTVATDFLKERYPGYGYNQVAESYLNFRELGIMVYFGFVSYCITRFETKKYSLIKLAYMGSITSILINATRNYFAFVPGQLLLVTFIYLIVLRFVKAKQNT